MGKNVYDAQTGQELPELNVKAIQAADATWTMEGIVE